MRAEKGIQGGKLKFDLFTHKKGENDFPQSCKSNKGWPFRQEEVGVWWESNEWHSEAAWEKIKQCSSPYFEGEMTGISLFKRSMSPVLDSITSELGCYLRTTNGCSTKLCNCVFERSGLPYSKGPERSYLYFESAFISWLQFISPSAKGIMRRQKKYTWVCIPVVQVREQWWWTYHRDSEILTWNDRNCDFTQRDWNCIINYFNMHIKTMTSRIFY